MIKYSGAREDTKGGIIMRGMMKVWIAGANGQIGTAIQEVVDVLDIEVLKTDLEDLDVSDTDEVLNFAELNRPDVIINCAAITDVTTCEENKELAFKINALGARNLSVAARKVNAKLVQLSTDDVFDGTSTEPYSEFDAPNPKTVYGRSKFAGENYVKEFTEKHFIIRSNWVFGKGTNFVTTFLNAIESQEEVSVAADQFGAPTHANDVAKVILDLIKTNEYGTYHITSQGVCSRYEFAQEILRLTGKTAKVNPVVTAESEYDAVRPAYAVLDNFILRILDMQNMPEWKTALANYIKEV